MSISRASCRCLYSKLAPMFLRVPEGFFPSRAAPGGAKEDKRSFAGPGCFAWRRERGPAPALGVHKGQLKCLAQGFVPCGPNALVLPCFSASPRHLSFCLNLVLPCSSSSVLLPCTSSEGLFFCPDVLLPCTQGVAASLLLP